LEGNLPGGKVRMPIRNK